MIPKTSKIWTLQTKSSIPSELKAALKVDEIVLQYLVNRGITQPAHAQSYLDFTRYTPTSPLDLPDMQKGIDRVQCAIQTSELIGVWGDFDVDGQTATAVIVSALRKLNARTEFYLPVRNTDSHGIALHALKRFLDRGVNLLVTCDTGISAHESIVYAQSLGIDVIVTDHHQLPKTLPPAYAVINPQRVDPSHPLNVLAGVGTAYKFVEALLSMNGEPDYSRQLHDLVALGTLADVARLTGENRYLVQSGLALMQSTPRPAIDSLIQLAEIDPLQINEEHVGFSLAPRLNAVGRLSDATPMVEFLLSDDPVAIKTQLNQIDGLNTQRKTLCDQVLTGALAQIEQQPGCLDHDVLILHHSEWPAGVVGIIASRLVDLYHRPVVLLTGKPGEPLRGSARSIPGIDINDALRQNSQQLLTFGGHPFAAGLSMAPESLPALQRGLDSSVRQMTGDQLPPEELLIEANLYPVDFSLARVKELNILAPFGPGNPVLTFAARGMRVTGSVTVGKLGDHLLVDVEDPQGNQTRLIWWGGARNILPVETFDLAYAVRPTNFRGDEQVQYEWVDFKQSSDQIDVKTSPRKNLNSLDFRASRDPVSRYAELPLSPPFVCWQEGSDTYSIVGANRQHLEHSPVLVIWSTPPDMLTLKNVITSVNPDQIAWFLIDPEERKPMSFLRSLGRLIKTAMAQNQFNFNYAALAAGTAATAELARLGIQWHSCVGNIRVIDESSLVVTLAPGGSVDKAALVNIEKTIASITREMQAFSTYLKRVDLDELIQSLVV